MSDPTLVETTEPHRPVADYVLAAVFWILGNMVCALLTMFFSFLFFFGRDVDAVIKAQSGLLASLLCSAALLKFASVREGEGFWSLRSSPVLNKTFLCIVACCWPLIYLLVMMAMNFFNSGLLFAKFSPSPNAPWPLLTWMIALGVVLIVPIAEEAFFRGWLWEKIEGAGGSTKAFIWTAALFWLMHLPLFAGFSKGPYLHFLALLPLTIALSWVRLKCGSVKASLVLHVVNNFLAIAPGHILRLIVDVRQLTA